MEFIRVKQVHTGKIGPVHVLTDDGLATICKPSGLLGKFVPAPPDTEHPECQKCLRKIGQKNWQEKAPRRRTTKMAPQDTLATALRNEGATGYENIEKTKAFTDLSVYDLYRILHNNRDSIKPGTKVRVCGSIFTNSTLGIMVSEDGSVVLMSVD